MKLNMTYSLRRFMGIFFLYALVATSLLAPITSNEVVPSGPEFIPHIIKIIQAEVALQEGQFPVRIEPFSHHGFGYPAFQFYSPFIFSLAAIIYKFFFPSNPFITLKVIIWLAVMLGGFYIYRLAKEINKHEISAILAGIAYMAAPYLLININARGDFTEVVGQGILPLVLYGSYKIYCAQNPSTKQIFLNGLTWALLAMTHLVTFVNASIIIALFFIFLSKKERFKNLILIGLAYLYGILLSIWFFAPIIKYASLLNIDMQLSSPATLNFLTLLPRLFAMTSASVMWFPSNYNSVAEQMLSPPFYPGIGWIMLMAAGLSFYRFYLQVKLPKLDETENADRALLKLFILTLFLTWSPVDFWKYLPRALSVTQFSYRFLAQLMWIGALLVSMAVKSLINPARPLQSLCLGILLIALSSQSWLMTAHTTPVTIDDIKQMAAAGWAQKDYLLKESLPFNDYSEQEKLLATHTMPTLHYEEVEKLCTKSGSQRLNCHLSIQEPSVVEFPFLYYPDLLNVMLDNQPVDYRAVKLRDYWLVKLYLNQGIHDITIRFTGLIWANWISILTWLSLIIVVCISFIRNKIKNLAFIKDFYLA